MYQGLIFQVWCLPNPPACCHPLRVLLCLSGLRCSEVLEKRRWRRLLCTELHSGVSTASHHKSCPRVPSGFPAWLPLASAFGGTLSVCIMLSMISSFLLILSFLKGSSSNFWTVKAPLIFPCYHGLYVCTTYRQSHMVISILSVICGYLGWEKWSMYSFYCLGPKRS